PQWDFLDFLRDEAAAYPGFALEMEAEVTGLVEDGGRVAGVRLADGRELRAGKLVLMTDGRASLVRRLSLLPVTTLGAPMDVLWFRVAKADNAGERLLGAVQTGRMAVLIDRRTYWQCAFLIPKGAAEEVKARGLVWLADQLNGLFPEIDLSGGPQSVDDLHLLSVAL
ncbi:MAG: FAD-dependent oxidoreductase, partial [Sphingopyxis sp.]|nr:FAD-dependent oxidoreductase [Sphingopyxis sp.]